MRIEGPNRETESVSKYGRDYRGNYYPTAVRPSYPKAIKEYSIMSGNQASATAVSSSRDNADCAVYYLFDLCQMYSILIKRERYFDTTNHTYFTRI